MLFFLDEEGSETYSDEDDDGRYDGVYSDNLMNNRSANRNRRDDFSEEGVNAVNGGEAGEVINRTRNPYYGVENNDESPRNFEVLHRTDNPYYLSSNRNRRPFTINVMSQNVIDEPDGAHGNNEPANNMEELQSTETPYYKKSKSQDN